jgi:hypothetical protein
MLCISIVHGFRLGERPDTPEGMRTFTRSLPLTTGSRGNRADLALRYGEYPDCLSSGKCIFEVELDRFTDIIHQIIERFTLGMYIDPDTAATPEGTIRIYFKFDEHGMSFAFLLMMSNVIMQE